MKPVYLPLLLACALVAVHSSETSAAGSPNLLNYQGRVNDTSGVPVSDGSHPFAFRIYAAPSGGSSLWTESVNLSTSGGLFNHILGSVSALPPTLFADSSLLFLETEVNGLTLSPRTQIVSVAYARRVQTVQGASGGTITGSVRVTDTLFASNLSSNSPLRLQTAGTTRMYIDDVSGSVGIGTTSPLGGRLHVKGSSFPQIYVENAIGNDGGIVLKTGSTSSLINFLNANDTQAGYINSASNRLLLEGTSGAVLTSGANVGVVVDGSGNVGIGTSTPAAMLDLTTNVAWVAGSWASNLRLTSVQQPALRFFATSGNKTSFIGNDNDGSLWFGVGGTGDNWAGEGAMILGPTGNLGLGTAPTSTERLSVAGDVQVVGTWTVNGNAVLNGIYPFIKFTADSFPAPAYISVGLDLSGGQRGHFMAFSVPTNSEGFTFVRGGNHMLTLDTSGNIGIGTTSPGNILSVVQSSSTDPIADAWTVYSSRRWKTHIEPLENALDKVERLRGVSFEWKKDGKHDIGLIAEEVGQVIPEVVAYEANGKDARSVDYARLVSVLIEAVKEQQRTIKGLESRVSLLEGSPASVTTSALPAVGQLPPK